MHENHPDVEFVDISHAPNSATSSCDGPGDILRNARLALGLSETDVAQKMYLSRDKIVALERNEYDKLAGTAFIRGYLRAYAGAVKLNPDSVVEKFNALGLRDPELPAAPVTYVSKQIGSNDKIIKYVTYGIGLLLLLLVFTWWNSHSSTRSDLAEVKSLTPVADAVDMEEPEAEEDGPLPA